MGHGYKGNLTLWERFFGPLVNFFLPRAFFFVPEEEKEEEKEEEEEDEDEDEENEDEE